jgi:hypothetical protein
MSDRSGRTPGDQEDPVATIIRLAGRRPVASDEARARVYAAVHATWQWSLPAQPRSRSAQSRSPRSASTLLWLAAAASVAAIAVSVAILRSPGRTADPVVATLQSVRGGSSIERAGERGWQPTALGVPAESELRAGDALRTAADGRAVLALAQNVSLRVHADTELVFRADDRIDLERGTVYLDSGARQHAGVAVHLRTPLGEVWDTGTQFELHAGDTSLRIRVREGAVRFEGSDRSLDSGAGDELLIPAQGEAVRAHISTYDDAWGWVAELASFRPEGDYSAATLLEWISRETGRALQYDSATTRAHAEALRLHGAEGLSPVETLDVVAATTDLQYEIDSNAIVVHAMSR